MSATSQTPRTSPESVPEQQPLWLGFVPYATLSLLHVTFLFAGLGLAGHTKLGLMPLLAAAVLWGAHRARPRAAVALLLVAIGFSWLGDSAGVFFPGAPTLMLMLGFFGLAHIAYVVLFWRYLALRRLGWWALGYVVVWAAIAVTLWPRLGDFALVVPVYGLLLVGTAALSTRCHPLIAVGAVFFLASDTLLAFLIFATEWMPSWTDPAVMITYLLGQGLIAAGAIATLRARSAA